MGGNWKVVIGRTTDDKRKILACSSMQVWPLDLGVQVQVQTCRLPADSLKYG